VNTTDVPLAAIDSLATGLEHLFTRWRRFDVPGELSFTAAATLRGLAHDGPSRLTDLAEHETVSQPAMTQLVTRLEGQGLVERVKDPADARVVLVRATTAGQALVEQRRAARVSQLADLFAALPPPQQDALLGALLDALPAIHRLADLPLTSWSRS
jgi:DNA-binding MarR family transcriptional regulator